MMTKFGFVEFAPWFVSFVPSAIKKDLSGSQVSSYSSTYLTITVSATPNIQSHAAVPLVYCS
ncbi:hypothetical protein H6F93_02295 [Leptolyngbya sp. FACHB-671]|nr:hypothetical protein [Leptolyngbya sp. FACHB-671]